MTSDWVWGRCGIVGPLIVTALASSGLVAEEGDHPDAGRPATEAPVLGSPKAAPAAAAVPKNAPGMAAYLAGLKVYDGAVEAREADKKAAAEPFDPEFTQALDAFQQALPKATDQKLKLECLYRVWRCHVWLRDEQAAAKAWEAFAAQLQSIEDAKAREELIRWQLTRRRTRADWDGAVKLLEWVAATNEGEPLERWAKDELAWTLFLPLWDYPKAMKLCEEIIEKWPDGDEARRAHFRLGMMWRCFWWYRIVWHKDLGYSQDEKVRAKEHFEVLVQRWPESLEARVARVELDDIALLLSGQKEQRAVGAKRRTPEGAREKK